MDLKHYLFHACTPVLKPALTTAERMQIRHRIVSDYICMSHPLQSNMSLADARNALTMLCTKKGCNDINCPMAHSNEELQRKLTSIEKKRKAKGCQSLPTQQDRQRLPTQVLSFVIKEEKRRRKKGRKGRKGHACIVSDKRGQADTRASLQRGWGLRRKPRSPTVLDPCRGEHAQESSQCESRALDCCLSAYHR